MGTKIIKVVSVVHFISMKNCFSYIYFLSQAKVDDQKKDTHKILLRILLNSSET